MSSYSTLPNNRADPDHVYYQANIINTTVDTYGAGDDPAAQFTETRNVPILRDGHDYEAVVLGCSIDGGGKTLPILVPLIQTGASQNNINLTVYSVTLCVAYYSGSTVYYATSDPQFIQWAPENIDATTSVPPTPVTVQADTPYYWCYSYNHWVVLVNRALQTAYTQLQTNVTAQNSGYTLQSAVPTVEYDEVTGLFSFYTTAGSTNSAWGTMAEKTPTAANLTAAGLLPSSAATEFMFVGYNLNFEGLMTNFDTQYYGYQQSAWQTGANSTSTSTQLYLPENVLIVRNKTGTNILNQISPVTGVAYSTPVLRFVTTQDFISTDTLWSPVQSIVLTTNMIPIRNEYVSAPVRLGSGNVKGQGTSSFQTILLDFGGKSPTHAWRGELTYSPQAEFIPVSLSPTHGEIKSVDFVVSWRNRLTNQLVPLRLYNTATLSVRILFRRIKQ
jgi:hypothetical protein